MRPDKRLMRSNQAWMMLTASVVSVVSCLPPFSMRNGGWPPGPGIDLYQVKLVLVADEVDVVVVGSMGDLESFDD